MRKAQQFGAESRAAGNSSLIQGACRQMLAVFFSILCGVLPPAGAWAADKTYHTDSGGDWACGSAFMGMTGVLSDSAGYACGSDSLTLDTPVERVGTWIAETPHTVDTVVSGEQIHLYLENSGSFYAEFDVYLGYTFDSQDFTTLGSQYISQGSMSSGEYVFSLGNITGLAPAGSFLFLRIYSYYTDYGTVLRLGTAQNSAGYIRISVDEELPCDSPVQGLTQGVTTSAAVALSWEPHFGTDTYNVYRDGGAVPIASVSETAFVDDTVQANTDYTYEVRNYNAALACEGPAASIAVRTLPAATDPAGHDFGAVVAGSSADQRFYVENKTLADTLNVGAATLSGVDADYFVVVDNTCSGRELAPEETCRIIVRFAPSSEGHKQATLTLPFGNPGALPLVVPLEGGVRPRLVKDILPGIAGSGVPTESGRIGDVWIFATNDGSSGVELWRSDGSEEGTFRVKDINPGSAGSNPRYFTAVDGVLFFTATDALKGNELWVTDGTQAGTLLVKDIAAGTGSSSPYLLTDVNGTLFFRASDAGGVELWKSDGTAAGTARVRDILPGSGSSYPASLTACNGLLYFQAYDGARGYELWKSDGTAAGTMLVKDIFPGANSGNPGNMAAFEGRVFFRAVDGSNGYELWASDGTESGTGLVQDIRPGSGSGSPSNLIVLNDRLYFTATDGVSGTELWTSDGTGPGTVPVKDIRPGSGSSSPAGLTVLDGRLFFSANDGVSGTELWASDGTGPGTVMVKDIQPGSGSSIPSNFTAVNGVLFFSANDGSGGTELWESDGTAAGTFRVMDIRPGAAGSSLGQFVAVDDTLYVFADDGAHGREPWAFQPAAAPALSFIGDAQSWDTNSVGPIGFTVGDPDTDFSGLQISVTSSNPALLPNANIVVGGSGGSRTLTLNPVAGQAGSTTVTVTVSDGYRTTERTFVVQWLAARNVPAEYPTIQAAIDASVTGDVVVVADGTYTGAGNTNVDFKGKAITVRSANGPEKTVIDCQRQSNLRGFVFQTGETNAAVLEGFTIKNANHLTSGGALAVFGSAAPVISNCVFKYNYAKDGGGAILLSLSSLGNPPTIQNCDFISNDSDYYGGAIRISPSVSGAVVEISGCRFERNSSRTGGAVYDNGSAATSTRILRCAFDKNTAGTGGAVFGIRVDISNCSFYQNHATSGGGAVGALTGIIKNTIFLKNFSMDSGGALILGEGTTTISNCSFAGNGALNTGGAIWLQGSAQVLNSIIWGNKAEEYGSQVSLDRASALSIVHSNLEGGLDGIRNPFADADLPDRSSVSSLGGNIDADPLFALAEDLHLMPGSPCVDAGSNSPPGGLPPDDLDGTPRPADGNGDGEKVADMGAYEFDRTRYPAAAASPHRIHLKAREGSPFPDVPTLYVRNRAAAALAFEVRADVDWLRTESEVQSSDDAQAVRLYVDHSGLAHGAYEGALTIIDGSSAEVLQTVALSLNVNADLTVPADYGTIQAAIDAAIDGDAVVVADGTYTGTGNKNIDFLGKAITVRSENGPEHTVIDCQNSGRAFYFHRGESSDSVLQGFNITGGNAVLPSGQGGGVYVDATASPNIVDCLFSNNSAQDKGGGLYTAGPGTYIGNCRFNNNSAQTGGGVYAAGDRVIIESGSFTSNSAVSHGGGLYFIGDNGEINNSVFKSNTGGSYGGGVYLAGDYTSCSSCSFYENKAGTGGGAMSGAGVGQTMVNCIFAANRATLDNGGGAYVSSWDADIIHCSFHQNEAPSAGGGLHNNYGRVKVINSVFYENVAPNQRDISEVTGPSGSTTVSYSLVSDAVNWPADEALHRINGNPLFLDPAGGDFRLAEESPCIDTGKTIPWLFSDRRGSLRPVDGDGSGTGEFDMGALEYSAYYGGIAGDLAAAAFSDLRINGSLAVAGFGYEIAWQDRDPFPIGDDRVRQADEYGLRLVLVSDSGRRLDLGIYTVAVSQHGYSIPFTFSPEHIGQWRIRLEMLSDPNQHVLSDPVTIAYKEATRYALSQWIKAPPGADPTVRPEADTPGAVHWSVNTNRLYAVAPITTVVTWYADAERKFPIPTVAYITYPDRENHPADPQAYIHVAGSMEVDLLPAGTRFDSAKIMYAGNDAIVSANRLKAAEAGWAVLMYLDDQGKLPGEMETFDVVRTCAWNHAADANQPPHPILNPAFPVESAWDIGEEVSDPDHAAACAGGYVFFRNARYDGYGENRAYDRESRSGPIFAVNEDDPDTETDDLVVIWYEQSAASGVCWPSKPVRYDPRWPADAATIVIASGEGSGPLAPGQYGLLEDMIVYSQPDRSRPGYNPNEEHAAFFTAQGSAYPGVFPLRTDLNAPSLDAKLYRTMDTSRPHVLLKYRDPATDRWNFEVYRIVAQSGSYEMQSGAVSAASAAPPANRYYLDTGGVLRDRTADWPAVGYHLDAAGYLVNPSDAEQFCYNYNGGVIAAVPCLPAEGVKRHYIDAGGKLQVQAGAPPSPAYSLDNHGVLVDSGTYHRFHYTATAGREINPPYPLNQFAFGPCQTSFTGTDQWVLMDKDDRFFAKNGGIDGMPEVDVVLHYFYRLQAGFHYDLDRNGVADEAVGTCIPWLDGLDGKADGQSPVKTVYAVGWPDPVPTLFVGETLVEAKTQAGETVGLPNVADQCVAEVVFDQSLAEGHGPAANLVDPLKEYAASWPFLADPAGELPPSLKPEYSLSAQRWVFTALPYHIQVRLTYDPVDGFVPGAGSGMLKLKGVYETGTGEPLLLLNVLTARDRAVIAGFDPGSDFMLRLDALISQGTTGLAYPAGGYPRLQAAEMKALTAGDAHGEGYLTLAFNNHEDCAAPTVLSVIRVGCPLYRGQLKVIESANPFEEKVTLRHNGDFGGNSDERWFEWMYLPADFSGIPEGPATEPGWLTYTNDELEGLDDKIIDGHRYFKGAVDATVEGTGQQLLPDKWFAARSRYDGVCAEPASEWTPPQLYEGWVKRVMKKINLFDQKVTDFHAADVNTLAGMISLAGPRYGGDVALSDDPEYLQNLGIIEVYGTLLNRGRRLVGEDGDYADINKALLFAANRLADLSMLLGNEALADATDPTIGFSTEDGQYGTEAPALFCFQNQVDSLLEEELALLRGVDDKGDVPFHNRLVWNFTLGDGEVAYKESYNITDQNQDGAVDERDAMIQFPQGHGDAWGHYLSAVKQYYDLLRSENFIWIPQSEAILVAQTPVSVDYRDERKFAAAAAAKAGTGAEIVNLTYRRHYVADPEEQWQGYKDYDPDRAWGVSEWAARAGQGAFFDWVVGNAILPDQHPKDCARIGEDPTVTADNCYEGIQKVDRGTVLELREIASRFNAIQAEVDSANAGLNPLGLAKNVVPFDIDPGAIADGQTHFEQIYHRAVQALNNAIAVFNHANQSTLLLRRQQDTLADFKRNVDNMEADYNNRLVEVFGYPYSDDCGSDRTYPTDYCGTGPDLYHYMYVEPSELMGVAAPRSHEFTLTFKDVDVDAAGALQETEKTVVYHVAADSRFGLIKPEGWPGPRKAPGEIQLARSDLLQIRGRFEKALIDYDNLLNQIERQADLIEAQHFVNREEINILNTANEQQITLNAGITLSRGAQLGFRTLGRVAVLAANAISEAIPLVIGMVAGTAAGTITDPLSIIRSGIQLEGTAINEMMTQAADAASLFELGLQQAKEIVSAQTNIQLTTLRGGFAVIQLLLQLESLVRSEAALRYELYNLAEAMQQAAGRYLAALAKGERLLQDRLRFRKQTAAQIQDYRYKDMTFRIFRNDALQKYRAQFDLAARYVYLAAKAYDYETTLLDSSTMAGQAFLADVVRQRTIGMIEGGVPLTGSGLADPMKRMWQNFQVIKSQLGFSNPQQETNRFSLRRELFRIQMDAASGGNWRQVLDRHRVADLWEVPEFRRHCRPFAPAGIPQPGIVIPFTTTVTSGLNFFEWPLGGGDSYYSAANFATKVRSVGVWFSNYNSVQLTQTPRVYLVPAGEDMLRTPSYYSMDVRTWRVVDQKMPVPFPIMETEMAANPDWIPTVDTLFDELFQIRRHSDFRAYHDSGYVNETEMTFDSRLVGRSVWNTRWLLIIPGRNLLYDPQEGLERFINGPLGWDGVRTGNGVSDIKLFFHTYAYAGE